MPNNIDLVTMAPSMTPNLRRKQGYFTQKYSNSKHSDPIVTGTSVLGIKYKDGVMIAADTLGLSNILVS
jgi:20S proteasome alpha/beta subunit